MYLSKISDDTQFWTAFLLLNTCNKLFHILPLIEVCLDSWVEMRKKIDPKDLIY